jgi:hypothetical protein
LAATFKLEDDDYWKTGESPKDLPNNHRRNPIPNAPLFPLLPSVQFSSLPFVRTRAIHSDLPEKKERPNWSIWPF